MKAAQSSGKHSLKTSEQMAKVFGFGGLGENFKNKKIKKTVQIQMKVAVVIYSSVGKVPAASQP